MRGSHDASLLLTLTLAVATLAPAARADSWLVAGEPFIAGNADLYTIGDTAGAEARNRAVATVDGVARNLALLPSSQPLVGSEIRGCVRINGVDTDVCATYDSGDWPDPVSSTSTVAVSVGDVVTIHLAELLGANTGANVRASVQISALGIFSDGFESQSTAAWPGPGPSAAAMVVAGEPFIGNGFDTYTIGGSPGDEARNRAAVPRDGTVHNLFLLPDQQPQAGGQVQACLSVDGVDTALCATYASADWPNPTGNTAATVAVTQGQLISVHVVEQGTGSNVNVRASFALGPEADEVAGSMIITSEPFLVADGDLFTIGSGSSGTEERNRATVPMAGTIRNLFVMPNLEPAADSAVQACIRVNSVDNGPCVTYTAADWPGPAGNTVTAVSVAAGDVVSVHLVEQEGVSSGANFRASFELQ